MSELPASNSFESLRRHTSARVAIGRTGHSEPLAASLSFKMAHAHARDAVFAKLDVDVLRDSLAAFNLPVLHLSTKAMDRRTYLQRPDWGRVLSEASAIKIGEQGDMEADIAIVLADGLSAVALQRHAVALLEQVIPLLIGSGWQMAPISIIEQGRVAVADEIGSLLKAKLSIILIGERPGLSAADSLGAYITFKPSPGTTDEARNCISNIRPEGLPYAAAAEKIGYLVNEALRRQISGVLLKDESDLMLGE
jgi:ethanolamine ammonia-lyase small subunit